MLTIRLQRAGKRNDPQYRVVLAQKTAANQKQFVEVLGFYNPHTKELGIRSNDRLNYWMNDQHVELSATVHNLFVTKELVKADKVHAFAIPKKEVVAEEPAAEAPAAEASADATEDDKTETIVEGEINQVADEPVQEPATEAPAEVAPPEVAAPVEVPAEPAAPEATPEQPPVEPTA